MTNVARHSKASEVSVTLSLSSDELYLEISDNGLGFESHGAPGDGHLGLLGMQERARELGGRIAFGTGPKSGACVRLLMPMPRNVHEHGDVTDDSPAARG